MNEWTRLAMLRIEMFHRITGHSEEIHVHESPARVGRHALSDVLIHERSVSVHHGQFTFDSMSVWYADTGSGNGSKLDGGPVPPHTFIPISPGQELDIGPVTLRVYRDGDSRFPRRHALESQLADEAVTMMTSVDVAERASGDTSEEWPSLGSTAIAGNAIQQLQHLRVALEAISPGRNAFVENVREQLDALPLATRGPVFGQLTREFPELLHMREFDGYLTSTTRNATGATPSEWLHHITGQRTLGAQGEPVLDARVLARTELVLRTFVEALVAMRASQSETARELGIEPAASALPTDARDVLAFLFDFKANGEERVTQLVREFAMLSLHPRALLIAMDEGITTLVDELSPSRVQQFEEEARRERKTAFDFLPTSPGRLWERYEAAHERTRDGAYRKSLVMGARFARAYASMVGVRPVDEVIPETRIREALQ
jgi:hypothetical protein